MASSGTCIVIGGSHAASQLVSRLRVEGWSDRILMISGDSYYPYHRPPLSKAFLSGEKNEDELLIRAKNFYDENGIEVLLDTMVTKIDRNSKSVHLNTGEVLPYAKLAICTGANVCKLNIDGANLNNIFYLRDLKDSFNIKKAVENKKKAVVVGAGYIGLETAASLKKLGLEVSIIEAQSRILERTSSKKTADYIARKFEEKGIKIITNELVASFDGADTVARVICKSGNSYDTDLVIVGIGVIPNVALGQEAGLDTGNGILVNKYAVTNDPDIVAAGDCTYHPNSLLGVSHRLESVPNANDQANSAAASICGKQLEYKSLPWFWSDQFDMKLQIAGLSNGYDDTISHKDNNSYSVWYFKEDKLIAVDAINDPVSFMVGKQILSKGFSLSTQVLKQNLPNVRGLLKTVKG